MLSEEELDDEADEGASIHTLVMLYEEAIRSIGRTAAAIEEGDVRARCRHVECAVTVVTDLYASLDMERGGDIARQLAVAYRLVLARLILVNGRNDAELARGAASLLKPILDAWRRIELECLAGGRREVAAMVATTADSATTARAVVSRA